MSDPMPLRPSADRNLLFGILALQMDFVRREALIAAMHAWVLDKAKPLGQILVEQQSLRPDARALLEPLVDKHLELHGHDAEQSLAAVGPAPELRRDLGQIPDPDLHFLLASLDGAPNPRQDAQTTEARTVGQATSEGLRFRVLRPHARGGLGEVSVALDTELHREVALKEIQDCYADDPHRQGRFLLEAEITGGLEHPGIVPVYGLGRHPDGRPFYAMRFVKGDSLKQAIERFYQTDTGQRDPGERALALRQLLGRFVDVCQAVAYAHSRGVLHRDLKPGNVMLGPYGETLVVDWGLAKPVGRPEGVAGSPEGTLRPPALSGSAETVAGSALGTPAYMPPEQAAGRLDELGPASDVYSLGATLYCLLTGKPPFAGGDTGDVLMRVRCGDFPPPRRVKPGVPAALEAVCLKAMALDPPNRYASPAALADDVEHWLADEPVGAWREPWAVRARRWARRNRTLAAAGATAVILAVLAGAGAFFYLQRQAAGLRQEVEAGLKQVVDFREQSRWPEAHVALDRTRARLGEDGPADLRQRLERELANLDLVGRLRAIRLKAASLAAGVSGLGGVAQAPLGKQGRDAIHLEVAGNEKTRFDYVSADGDYAKAFQEAGLARQGEDPALVAARVRTSPVAGQLLPALDDWARVTRDKGRRAWVLAVARKVDPHELRDSLRDPALWEDPAALKRQVDRANVADLSPTLAVALGARLSGPRGPGVPVLTKAQAQHRDDFWLAFVLANALKEAGQPRDAAGFYRVALALRPKTSVVLNNLGLALEDQGRQDEANEHYYKAIEIDPRTDVAYVNLGNYFKKEGQTAKAIEHYKRAIEIDPGNAVAHSNLSFVLLNKNQVDKAVEHGQKAVALDPENVSALNNFGLALQARARLDEAIACYKKALKIDPRFAKAHSNLGNALADKGRLDEAMDHYTRAIAIDPNTAGFHSNFGTALVDQGRLDEAIEHYHKAIALDPKHAKAYYNLGNALHKKGLVDEAIRAYHKAIALDPRDAKAHNNIGWLLRDRGRLDEAIDHCRKAIALDPALAAAYNSLGAALLDQNRVDEAIRQFKHALALDPNNVNAHYNLGVAAGEQGRVKDAIGHYNKAIAINPRYTPAHLNLGNMLRELGRLDEAVKHGRKAVQLEPKNATAHNILANALLIEWPDEAIKHYEKAVRLAPKEALYYSNLGNALLFKGEVDKAIAHCRKAIALDHDNVKAHYVLGRALIQKNQPAMAIEHFRTAIKLDPHFGNAYWGLGDALMKQGQLAQAIQEYHKALAKAPKLVGTIGPTLAEAHFKQGNALMKDGQLSEAIKHYQKALEFNPKADGAHLNLGNALRVKGRLDEAIKHYEKAVRLAPKLAVAHFVLGRALMEQGRFTEARDALRLQLDQLPQGHSLRPAMSHISRQCQQLLALAPKLPAIRKGVAQPADEGERLLLGRMCRYKKLYATAARFYAESMKANPLLAALPATEIQYAAACCAALAGTSKGEDAAKLDDKERTRLRQQARDWLTADLGLWARQLKSGKAADRAQVRQKLLHWQQDADLAGIRDAADLDKLPESERVACRKLWADVADLLKKAGESSKP